MVKRPASGERSPLSSKPKLGRTAKFTVMLPPVVVVNIDIYAAQQRVSRSSIVETAIDEYLSKKGVRLYESPTIVWK